jgi:hypothetical protein
MRHFASALLILAAACAPEPATSSLPADFSALVPADAFVVMQLRSVRELADAAAPFREAADPGQRAPGAEQLMAELRQQFDLPDAVQLLDLDQPLGWAISQGASVLQPVPTFIFPTTDPQAFMGFMAGMIPDTSMYAQGSYVAVRIGQGTAAAGSGSPLLADFPSGLMSARADLTAILASYRPLIDVGIASFEKAMESELLDQSDMPFNIEPMMEWYVEVFRGVMDSAERLDFSTDMNEMRVAFEFALHNREGSMLAKLGRAERVDYPALAARLDPDAMAQVVSCYSQADLITRFSGLYDEWAQSMQQEADLPPEAAALAADYFTAMKEIVPMLGREAVVSYDIHADGLRMSADIGAPDPAALASRMTAFLRSAGLAACGFEAGAESRGELGGQEAVFWRQNVNEEKFFQALPEADAGAAGVLKSLLGDAGLEIAMMPGPDRLRMVAGGDAAWRESAARRLAGTGTADAELLRELASLEGANPGMFFRIDLAAMFRIMGELSATGAVDDPEVEAFAMLAEEFENAHMPLNFYWGVKGRTMVAGGGADLGSLVRLMSSQSER